MTNQIKTCPLCPGRGELKHPLGEGWWQVICQSCGCRTGETHKLSAEQVIERWNTRSEVTAADPSRGMI
jgi:Restriction alleviation protein Lar